MEKPDLEMQLKVWKELAVSKQVLMQGATKALGLKAECSTQELEEALKNTIEAAKAAEAKRLESEEKYQAQIKMLGEKLELTERRKAAVVDEREAALKAHQDTEHRLAAGKSAGAEDMKKLKNQLADKQKEFKQITKILADTPENVVKKMKGLKKEKMDESNSRKRAEEVSRTLRKEKQTAEQDLKDSKVAIEQAGELAEKCRELQKFANEQFDLLAENTEDKSTLTPVPMLDESLLESIEEVAGKEKKED